MKVIQKIRVFRALLQGYVRKMYATNLSEIDKTFYQIAYHSPGNPRAPRRSSLWQVLGIDTVASGPINPWNRPRAPACLGTAHAIYSMGRLRQTTIKVER